MEESFLLEEVLDTLQECGLAGGGLETGGWYVLRTDLDSCTHASSTGSWR
jgi:hypothetical protein